MSPDFEQIAAYYPATRGSLERLSKAGYSSVVELSLEVEDTELLSDMASVLGFSGDRRHVPKLINLVLRERRARFCALDALGKLGGERAFQQLRRWTVEHPEPGFRYDACYSLHTMHEQRAYSTFLAVALNQDEFQEIRGQALEGLGALCSGLDRRSVRYKRLVPRLRELLCSPSPEVRFWALFTAGCARCEELLPEMRELLDDRTRAQGFWTVGEEAEDMIELIGRGAFSSDRRAVGVPAPFSWE